MTRTTLIRLGHLAFIAAVCAGLEALVTSGSISRLILSRPRDIVSHLWEDLQTTELWLAISTTVFEVVTALALSLTIGGVLGLLLWRMQIVRKALEPLLVAFYSAPALLLYPFVMVFLNQGSATVITMAVIMGSIPIAINVAIGFAQIEPIWAKVGRSMCATPVQTLLHIMVPAAIPTIVTGFRLGLTFALISVIAIEFLTYSGGLGRLVSWRYFTFDTVGVYSAILLVMTLAMIINAALNALERRVGKHWH
jgi:NitT/TauT family transport system permease protein